jgi:outer membrane biosynthesis protein TonB
MPIRLRVPVALRLTLLAIALLAATSPLTAQDVELLPAHDALTIPLTTRWPSRQGIAVLAPHQVNPMAIEATGDGWVVLRPFTRAERRDDVPTSRLHASPDDVSRWTTAARRLLAQLADSSRSETQGELTTLGRGRLRIAPHYWVNRRKDVSMQLVDCAGVWNGMDFTPAELETLIGVLDRAAAVARRNVQPTPPTLDRPYYSSEVSCAARRDADDAPPVFPSTMPRSARRYTEVGARFIVDTAGFVEAGSVALIPGVPRALARAARTQVERWRYRPAEWSGLPVRQVVNTVVTFDPQEQDTRRDSARVAIARKERTVEPAVLVFRREPATLARSDDGWVHVRVGRWQPDGFFEGYQEWFDPDSVDEWLVRTRKLVAADSAQPRRPPPPREPSAIAVGPSRDGNRFLAQYSTGWSSDTERLKIVTLMNGCTNATVYPRPVDRRLLEQLGAAAREARSHRASLPSSERTYARGEVACSAFIPPVGLGRADLPGLARYPRAPYPDALAKENVRAEVLSSFVVDTTGTVIASTLLVAPGADPRAVASLRQSIGHVRFQPALRAGQRVPSRVFRAWLFEPPATCAEERDGVDCARVYSRER